MSIPNITCERMTVVVPNEIASSDSVAKVRAGIFAQLAMWIGTPGIESCEPVPGGFRVTLAEVSASTALAKRGGR